MGQDDITTKWNVHARSRFLGNVVVVWKGVRSRAKEPFLGLTRAALSASSE